MKNLIDQLVRNFKLAQSDGAAPSASSASASASASTGRGIINSASPPSQKIASDKLHSNPASSSRAPPLIKQQQPSNASAANNPAVIESQSRLLNARQSLVLPSVTPGATTTPLKHSNENFLLRHIESDDRRSDHYPPTNSTAYLFNNHRSTLSAPMISCKGKPVIPPMIWNYPPGSPATYVSRSSGSSACGHFAPGSVAHRMGSQGPIIGPLHARDSLLSSSDSPLHSSLYSPYKRRSLVHNSGANLQPDNIHPPVTVLRDTINSSATPPVQGSRGSFNRSSYRPRLSLLPFPLAATSPKQLTVPQNNSATVDNTATTAVKGPEQASVPLDSASCTETTVAAGNNPKTRSPIDGINDLKEMVSSQMKATREVDSALRKTLEVMNVLLREVVEIKKDVMGRLVNLEKDAGRSSKRRKNLKLISDSERSSLFSCSSSSVASPGAQTGGAMDSGEKDKQEVIAETSMGNTSDHHQHLQISEVSVSMETDELDNLLLSSSSIANGDGEHPARLSSKSKDIGVPVSLSTGENQHKGSHLNSKAAIAAEDDEDRVLTIWDLAKRQSFLSSDNSRRRRKSLPT